MKLDSKTLEELLQIKEDLHGDPKNKQEGNSIYRYNKKTRAKLEKIDWAIFNVTKEARLKSGEKLSLNGYSGRNSNR